MGRNVNEILIKVIYDNRKVDPSMCEGWGFSCLIEFGKKKILFDTGADSALFFSNIDKLDSSLSEVTHVVCSHKHADHVTGLEKILGMMNDVHLFLPKRFPSLKKASVSQITYVSDLVEVDPEVHLIALKGGIFLYEQALILHSTQGLVVITGCAHPGVIKIIEAVKDRFNKNIHLILGGFHLFRKRSSSIHSIVDQIQALGVEKVAPCHCSGDAAIEAFKHVYHEKFYQVGVGSLIYI